MFKNKTIGMKVGFGFGILVLITMALGITSVVVMKNAASESSKLSEEYVPNLDIAMELRGAANRIMYDMFGYIELEDASYYEAAQKEFETMTATVSEGRALAATANNLKDLDSKLGKIESSMEKIKDAMITSHENIEKISEERDVLDKNAAILIGGGEAFIAIDSQILEDAIKKKWKDNDLIKIANEIAGASERIAVANEIMHLGNDMRIKTFKAQARNELKLLDEGDEIFAQIEKKFQRLTALTSSDQGLALIDAGDAAIQNYKAAVDRYKERWETVEAAEEAFETAGAQMIETCKTLADIGMMNTTSVSKEIATEMSAAAVVMVIGLLAALVFGCVMALIISRGITTSIKRIVFGLRENSEQVASSASQISAASQVLAEGASEQAASIEETSSSLEEMSAMTQQNATNAGEADSLVKQSAMTIGAANESMSQLTSSMQEISDASAETSKIIKTIDEIAFQTNLLALNAAVEAARAGEAGAGFAVVADEVRNLAMRAAEAAKNTADLIEGTGKKIDFGGELVTRTNEAFSDVSTQSSKVGELVAEIAIASKEQSAGIGQVNTAIGEMDHVVQKNAANAEESASAAEEMNAMVEQMTDVVKELVKMVGGNALDGQNNTRQRTKQGHRPQHDPMQTLKKLPVGKSPDGRHLSAKSREVSPSQVIPMDDEFKDF